MTVLVERLPAEAAAEAEVEACHAIEKECFPTPTLDLRAELARAHARAWVARLEPGGPSVGFLLAWLIADELHVLTVATSPSARRRGVGRALVEAALAEAARERCSSLQLEVRRNNTPAIELYRRAGFYVVNVRPRYYADNDEDAVLMTARLDPETFSPLPGEDDPPIFG